jgi:hypothetical protein
MESLLAYAGVMNAYLPERVGMLCLYDLNRFGGDLAMIAVQAHPFVLEGPWSSKPRGPSTVVMPAAIRPVARVGDFVRRHPVAAGYAPAPIL